MNNAQTKKPGGDFKLPRRKAVTLAGGEQVRVESLCAGKSGVVVRPAASEIDLTDWAGNNLDFLEATLREHGTILFRDFGVRTAAHFDEFVKAVSHEMAEYQEPATPRTHVRGNVYTSTDFPPDRRILLHNENSHCPSWPLRIFFFCVTPAARGGETPVADSRRVYRRIEPRIRERFLDRGVMYVRNFGSRLALPWQAVFNTSEPGEVEAYCRRHGIEAEWREGGRLRIRYVRPAAATHPRTGEAVWFNHVPLFHVSKLDPVVRRALLDEFTEEGLPYNAYYGDGTPIAGEDLEAICEVYRQEQVTFAWQRGDVLMLDNMLTAHGREPFVGAERKILVGMAEPVHLAAV
jgi:alpha-ketoglutarate-dependent taurine dioxygenase